MEDQRARELAGWYQRLRDLVFSSIRSKIILPYLILTVIVAALGIFVVIRLVSGSLDERLTNQLLEAGRAISDGMARKELEHLESARTIAYTAGLNRALHDGDREQVVALAQPTAFVQGLESLIIADGAGHEAMNVLRQGDGSYQSVAGQFDISGLWMVRALLEAGDPNGLPRRGLVFHAAAQQYYYFTATPIGLENDVVGVVIVGTSLDTLLVLFKSTSLADVIIYLDGGRAVATTFAFAENPAEIDSLLDRLSTTPALYESAFYSFDSTLGEGVEVRGRMYRVARGPLRVGSDGLGVFAVALPLGFVIEGNTTSRNTYALIFAAGMAGVVFVGYLVSRIITRPLGRLVHTSQAVADGDLQQRTGIKSTDEIGILAGTFDEMTERLAERTQALEEALGRMRAILSSMGDGVLMENMDGNLITLNQAADDLLEEMATGFMLGPLRDLSSSDYDLSAAGELVPRLLEYRRFEVGRKMISVHSSTVLTDEGEELGTVIVMRDVTAEVEAERLKDEFITHVSHELRTPLTAIKGFSDLLLAGAGGDLEQAQHSFVDTIGRNTDDLIAMVNELIDYSEMEAKGQLAVVMRPTQLLPLVEDVAEEWRPRMDDKGLTFHLEVSDRLPPVDADSRRLRWAIIHLVRNALQYTPAEGNVTLRLFKRDGDVVLDVEDSGIGISPEHQEHLFNRFYRVTNMPEEEVRGLGVGLYLASAIIEAHGGEILVESEEGVGSTFSVILPALSDDAQGGKGIT
jgi:two-component system sensor histidine kinase VicK